MKEVITSSKAPAPIGSYSPAIKINNILYLSGQIALQPATNFMITSSIADEVEQVFTNIQSLLHAGGSDLNQIINLTVYVMDLADMPIINAAIAQHIAKPYPARTSIQVSALPNKARVEITVVAACY
jgi:2-iminobutanoate/2-iminopropanoate deaminase